MIKLKTLTPEVQHIVRDKGTEKKFSASHDTANRLGTYLCRGCGLALYRGEAALQANCGWPAFDASLTGQDGAETVKHAPDADGHRTEILCARCEAHLGHVFLGEGYTANNTRHCVNATALDFVNSTTILDSEEAVFAGGCFWGMQHLFDQLPGVVKTEVGYSGGWTLHPSYRTVCRGDTGHLEVTRVIIDVAQLDYTTLAKYFFEIHDPTQENGQGPDVGPAYLSAAFYYNAAQQATLQHLTQNLQAKGWMTATQLRPAAIFWKAEAEHQAYYAKTVTALHLPPLTCHNRVKRFA